MRNIYLDVKLSLDLIKKPIFEGNNNCYKIYFNTNEELDKVLSITDLTNKDILCVQASSDQLFKCLEKGASDVDTFDINYLAKYFFYIKKYYFLKFGEVPNCDITIPCLFEVLEDFNLNDLDELEAYLYWDKLLSIISIEDFFRLFYVWPEYLEYDVDKVKLALENFKLNFHLINMFDNIYEAKKQYNSIIMSNILESTGIMSNAHELLNRLCADNGEVICSNLSTYNVNEHSVYERANMDKYFRYNEGLIENDDKPFQVAYKYIKR